jgi:hypothetical protein
VPARGRGCPDESRLAGCSTSKTGTLRGLAPHTGGQRARMSANEPNHGANEFSWSHLSCPYLSSQNCAIQPGSPILLASMRDENRNSAAVDQEPFHIEKRSVSRADGAGRLRRARSHRAVRLVAVRGELSNALPFGCGRDAVGYLCSPFLCTRKKLLAGPFRASRQPTATSALIDDKAELAIKRRMRDVSSARRTSGRSDLRCAATTSGFRPDGRRPSGIKQMCMTPVYRAKKTCSAPRWMVQVAGDSASGLRRPRTITQWAAA